MKHNLKLVEKDGKYVIYEGEQEYLTPLHLPICVSDKGLAESIIRKITESKPNLVKLYLSKYDKERLVAIISELASNDSFFDWQDINKYLGASKTFCKETHLRKLIDAYSECGSIILPYRIGIFDVWDEDLNWSYDPFMAGMAANSGIYMSEETEFANTLHEEMYDFMDDDIVEQISDDYMAGLVSKFNAFILPSAPRTRKRFFSLFEEE